MLKPIYSVAILTAMLLVSCADISQTIVIDYDEQTEMTFLMDVSTMLEMSEMLSDSTDTDAIDAPKTEESTPAEMGDIDPLAMLDKPGDLPEVLDTIVAMSDDKSIDKSTLTDEEIDMLDRILAKVQINKAENIAKIGFIFNYSSIEEKEKMMTFLGNKIEEREKAKNPEAAANPEEEGKANFSDMLSSLLDYSVDMRNGIITVKEQIPPKEMSGDEDLDFENMEPSQLAMMEAFMPGGITTRFELPGKVFKVTGAEHKILSDNIVEIHFSYISIMKNNALPGYKIEFTPEEPITDPKVTEVWEPEPAVVTPAKKKSPAPSDAIILFSGKNADAWQHDDLSPVKWKVGKKEMTVTPGTGQITTKETFGDCQLHLEWKSPVEKDRKGQDKGNSGVFLQGKYEVQILNSYQNRTYSNGQAASIYKQYPPMVNAMNPPGEWNIYDIIFHAPEFDTEGIKTKSGTLTVIHNGILVQDNVEILGTTEYIGRPLNTPHEDGPIILQDHSNKVSFRNIWLRKL